jgi:hypothetical protein
VKCETVDKNKSIVFDLFDRTGVGVVEDDIISNRQSGHCGSSKSCLNTSLVSAKTSFNEAVYKHSPGKGGLSRGTLIILPKIFVRTDFYEFFHLRIA